MKKTLLFAATAAILATGCNMQSYDIPTKSGEPIRFTTSGLKASVETKASEVTSSTLATSGFYVSATTGTALQDETNAFSDVLFTKSGDFWTGGKLWAAEDPGYHFFASNVEMSDAQTISASNATDVVVAYLPDPVFREENTLAFKHIFARLHNVTIEVPSGYTVSDVDVRLTPYTSGTFDIRSGYGETDGTGWSSLTAGESVSIAAADGSLKANDIYLVPGKYTLSASWTVHKDAYSYTYNNIEYEVGLVGGKENNVTMTLYGHEAGELAVSFLVSVESWGVEEVVAEQEAPVLYGEIDGHEYVDLGLRRDGKKILFATMNIGASAPQEHGDYFAWAETSKRYTGINGTSIVGATFTWNDCPYCTNSYPTTSWSKYFPVGKVDDGNGGEVWGEDVTLEAGDDVAHVQWGGGWHMPDRLDLGYLISDNVTFVWTGNYNNTGKKGLVVTGKGLFSTASLFLPGAGVCEAASVYTYGRPAGFGSYWSRSMLASSMASNAMGIEFYDGSAYDLQVKANYIDDLRKLGKTVRPVIEVLE